MLTAAGGRSRKRVYGRTRAEVFEKLAELQRLSRRGLPVTSSAVTVGSYLQGWLQGVARESVRPSTFRSYEMYVRLHLIPALGAKRLTRLSPTDVRLMRDYSDMRPVDIARAHGYQRIASLLDPSHPIELLTYITSSAAKCWAG